MGKIKCTILTPEKMIYEGDVDFAVVEAHDGARGFLYNHCPMISELGIGEVKLRSGESSEFMIIEGGLVEIKDNKMIVLAESAVKKSDLNKDEIQKQLDRIAGESSKERILLGTEERKLKARMKLLLK
jgi:F-type H+-transporting ATPase subunit epsilon